MSKKFVLLIGREVGTGCGGCLWECVQVFILWSILVVMFLGLAMLGRWLIVTF